ncbi:MAG: hypothetical protein ACYDD2_11345 [Candidatus Acidiferrales bacterium]
MTNLLAARDPRLADGNGVTQPALLAELLFTFALVLIPEITKGLE